MEAMIASFDRFFEIVPVVTDEQLHQALWLRYQVYCLEMGFESVDEHPGGIEQDEFDKRSVHSLLIHRQSGLVAGTVRLVLPNHSNLEDPYPMEISCGTRIRRPITGTHRSELGEISRFCISREFKRRAAESGTLWGDGSNEAMSAEQLPQRRIIPHISLGLIAATIRMSTEHGIRYWYALMEPSLVRFLQRFGINFDPIGPLLDHRGERQPCFSLRDQVVGGIRDKCYPLWELCTARGTQWPGNKSTENHKHQAKDARLVGIEKKANGG